MIILPDRKFLFRSPIHFIALGFGSGLSVKAPGTFGTILGYPLFALLLLAPESTHLITIAVLFLVGIPICGKTGKALGVEDHSGIVWDEIVAMMLVLEFTPQKWEWWLAAFCFFRLYDIWKPYPIRQFDATLKGGLGVMFDDLLAAIYTIGSLKALQWLLMNY